MTFRRRSLATFAVTLLGFGLATDASPATTVPGDLDVSFSGDGRQTADFGGLDAGAAVAVQGDGRIVVAGSSGGNFALARYGADGALDASFSGDGLVTTDLGGTDGGQGVAVQADGRIVVAGSSGGNFALARYSADGALDTSFSGDGVQTTDFGAADGGTAVALQADGRIVVGGTSGGNFALARYDAQGVLDTSFSGDGKQTTDFGGFDSSNDVAIGADGAIVAVGTHAFGDLRAANFAVARYGAGGALVSTQTTDFGHSQSTYDSGEGVAIQADGRIVVVGYGAEQSQFGGYYTRDLQLARYNVSGTLDSTFSDDGRLATRLGNADTLGYGVALEGNGRIVATGKAGGALAIARFNTDGTLDGTFSDDGKQTADAALAGADEVGVDGVLQADGKLVAVGTAAAVGGTDFVLARFNGDTPDPNPPGPNTPETRISGGPSGPTNVTAPSYTFTATLPGSTFECKLDGPGATTGTYTSCGSPRAYGELVDGRYTFSVRATRLGITDPTPATRPFTVDTVAPGLVYDAVPPASSSNPWAQLRFHSTEPDSTFRCELGFTETPSFDIGPCVSPKVYPFAPSWESYAWVFATDAAGNESAFVSSPPWAVDHDPPIATILSGPSGPTSTTTASFEFNSNEEGTFECKLDGPGTATGTYSSCSSPKTYSGLSAGSYTFSTRAIDLAENVSSPETRSFTVAPIPTPTPSPSPSPTGCAATNSTDVQIPDLSTVESSITVSGCPGNASATATAEVHIVHTYIGDLLVTLIAPDGSTYLLHNRAGGSTDNLTHTYTVNLSSEPANGIWKLRVQDAAAADVGRIDAWTISLGAGPIPTPSPTATPTPPVPDTTITSGPSGPTNGTTPSFGFTASVANSTFTCKLDTPAGAGSYAACTSPRAYTTTANGSYTFSVRATSAGGSDATPAMRTFTVDTVAPTTSIDSGPVGSTTDDTPRFTFSSNEPGSFECRLDTVETPGFFEPCSSPLDLGPLAGGVEYALFVRAIDAAGNADPGFAHSGLFVVDGSPPDTWIDEGPTGVTSVTAPVFRFHATLGGSTFECKLDRPAGAGSYEPCSSPQAYTTTANGPYTLTVRATSNGRTDESPATQSFTVMTPTPTPSPSSCTATNGTDVQMPDLSTVQSLITVSGCPGNASATATTEVHIVHTYVGDLIVSLIAPDGSTYLLHNRAGGSTDNLNRTYTVNLSSEPANGTWKLRVQDAAAADFGRIDSWSINL